MPKIRIREVDKTGVAQAAALSNTVYIPGPSKDVFERPVLFTSVSELEAAIDDAGTSSLSYRLAKHLLNYGLYVIYDGLGSEVIENINNTLAKRWEIMKDKASYDVRFLTRGQYSGVDENMINCAAVRGDCIALCDLSETEEDGIERANYAVNTRAKFAGLSNGEYAAAFAPTWYTYNKELSGDNEGTRKQAIPASFGYLFAYAKSIRNNPEWFAVAGSERGVIDELHSVKYEFSGAECEILQGRGASGEVDLDDDADNVGFAINPIAKQNPFGIVIWGNRTLKNNDAKLKTTTQSFLNVRNGVNAIKKSLYTAARKYVFEQNSETLWINFTGQVTPLLNKMKANQGLYDYKFTKLPTTAKARLCANLKIIPIDAVEDFDLTLELTDSLEVVE